MKKIIQYILTVGVLLFSFSCKEETIDLSPIQLSESDFYQDEGQMESAVFGVYQKLGFFYHWNLQNFLQRIDLLPSDDMTRTGGGPFENFVQLNGNNGRINDLYINAYQLIGRANALLLKIEENGDFAYSNEPELADIHRGEALFLRAVMYLKLWNTFGTAPLVTERIVDLQEAFPPNTVDNELLDQAIIDFSEAADLLPESWDSNNVGRATKNSARGFLLKTLVFRGSVSGNTADFTEALSAFNAISGVSLTPNYNSNFDAQTENNQESLFELQASDNIQAANGWLPSSTDGFAVIGEINAYYGYFTNSFEAGVTYSATESLLNAYNQQDPRFILSYDPDGGLTNILKYISTDQLVEGANPGNLSVNNPRILRYADAMLLASEAIVRSGGNLGDAIDLVNRVRERARNSSEPPSTEPADLGIPATSNEALELIFQERRLELAAEEGHRWHDLRRRHIAGEIDLTTWDFDSTDPTLDFQEFNIYLPLPQNEVINNPNLDQNEGY